MDNSSMECQICREQYRSGEYCPRILPCSHTFCSMCIDRLILKRKKRKTCPICRQKYEATSALDLTVNRDLLEVSEQHYKVSKTPVVSFPIWQESVWKNILDDILSESSATKLLIKSIVNANTQFISNFLGDIMVYKNRIPIVMTMIDENHEMLTARIGEANDFVQDVGEHMIEEALFNEAYDDDVYSAKAFIGLTRMVRHTLAENFFAIEKSEEVLKTTYKETLNFLEISNDEKLNAEGKPCCLESTTGAEDDDSDSDDDYDEEEEDEEYEGVLGELSGLDDSSLLEALVNRLSRNLPSTSDNPLPTSSNPPPSSDNLPQASGNPQPASGNLPPTSDNPPPMSGNTPPTFSNASLTSVNLPAASSNPLPMFETPPPISVTPPSASGNPLPTSSNPPLMSDNPPSSGNFSLASSSPLPKSGNPLLTSNNPPPSSDNLSPMSGNPQPASGNPPPTSGNPPSTFNNPPPMSGNTPPTSSNASQTSRNPPPTSSRPLPMSGTSPPMTGSPPSASGIPLPISSNPLTYGNFLLISSSPTSKSDNPPPTSGNPPPTSSNPLPSSDNLPPVSGNPQPSSGNPPPTSGNPPPTFDNPPPTSSNTSLTSLNPPPTSSNSLSVSGTPPPMSGHPPPASGNPLPTSSNPPLMSDNPSTSGNFSLASSSPSSKADNPPPASGNPLPASRNSPQTSDNPLPSADNPPLTSYNPSVAPTSHPQTSHRIILSCWRCERFSIEPHPYTFDCINRPRFLCTKCAECWENKGRIHCEGVGIVQNNGIIQIAEAKPKKQLPQWKPFKHLEMKSDTTGGFCFINVSYYWQQLQNFFVRNEEWKNQFLTYNMTIKEDLVQMIESLIDLREGLIKKLESRNAALNKLLEEISSEEDKLKEKNAKFEAFSDFSSAAALMDTVQECVASFRSLIKETSHSLTEEKSTIQRLNKKRKETNDAAVQMERNIKALSALVMRYYYPWKFTL